METLHELHRGCDLFAELVEHGLARRVGRVEVAGDVGDQRDARRPHVETLQRRHEWHRRRSDDGRVERVTHRDPGRLHVGGGECVDGCEHGVGGAADHRLVVGVDVGDDDVPGGLVDDPFDLGERAEDRCHRTVVLDRERSHFSAPGTHGFQRGVERERASGDERAVLSQAVPHHHVGVHAVRGEQPTDGGVGRQHRGLGDLSLEQLLLELGDGRGIVAVDEDVRRQRTTEQWRHHVIRLLERLGDDRFAGTKLVEHVDVLRSLAGIEERHFRRGAAAHEHALLAQHAVDRGVVAGEGLDGLRELRCQVVSVGEVDRDAYRSGADGRVGSSGCRSTPGLRVGQRGLNLREQVGVVAPTEDERPAGWELCRVGVTRGGDNRRVGRGPCDGRAGEDARGRLVASGHVLLEDDVEVRAAEAERAHAGPTDAR